jgi:predicted PolB exonuclease-like 3'-5' exonuclease
MILVCYHESMTTLILDIETVGEDFEKVDALTKAVLTKSIDGLEGEEYERGLAKIVDGLGLSPLTGRIVSIGMLDLEYDKAVVYYDDPTIDEEKKVETIGNTTYKVMDEVGMLQNFWDGAKKYTIFVTFNGRGFDIPFLMARSAVHGIHPTMDLMDGRYLYQQKRGYQHIDLYDQFSFYGSVRNPGGLHLWCRAMGISTSKSEGVSGDAISEMYRAGRYMDIAKYNAEDIRATGELYKKYTEYYRI